MSVDPEPGDLIQGRIPMLKTLGIRHVESSDRHAVMAVSVTDAHANYFGGAHGGLIATLIDTACFFPLPFLPSRRRLTTTQLQVNYVRGAAVGDALSAHAEILHLGRRTASLSVKVVRGDGALVAHGTAGLMFLDNPEP